MITSLAFRIILALSVAGIAFGYVAHLKGQNTKLISEAGAYEMAATQNDIALNQVRTDLALRNLSIKAYQTETIKRRAEVNKLNGELSKLLKVNSMWANPDIPDDAHHWLLEIENTDKNAGGDPAPSSRAPDTNSRAYTAGCESRGVIEGSGQLLVSFESM